MQELRVAVVFGACMSSSAPVAFDLPWGYTHAALAGTYVHIVQDHIQQLLQQLSDEQFSPKETVQLKIGFAPMHLSGTEMVRDAFTAPAPGQKVPQKRSFVVY